MPAGQAFAEVNPGIADLEAFFTAICAGVDIANLIEMRAFHRSNLSVQAAGTTMFPSYMRFITPSESHPPALPWLVDLTTLWSARSVAA